MSRNDFDDCTFSLSELDVALERETKKQSKKLKEKFRSMPDGFWEFQKYMDDSSISGYTDEQLDVKLVAYCIMLLIYEKVSTLMLSMPRRRRKSHAVNDAVKYVVGFFPERSNARYSYAVGLVKKHSRRIRDEIRSIRFSSVFTDVSLKPDAKSATDWEVTQCAGEPTFHCAGVSGSATGHGVNKLLVGDDLVKGFQEAHSEAKKEELTTFISGNFESCEEDGMVLFHTGTRFAEDDPIGNKIKELKSEGTTIHKFDAYNTKITNENIDKFINNILQDETSNIDAIQIIIPALDKDDETTCPYHPRYTTAYYRKIRDKLFRQGKQHIWYSIYQQDPRPKGGLLFDDFDNYYFVDSLDSIPSSNTIVVIDPAGKGKNNTSCTVARLVKDNIYILPDMVYSPEEPKITKQLIVELLKKNNLYKRVSLIAGEGNGSGDIYCETLEELLQNNVDKNICIDIINTDQTKELKIFLDSDWIKAHVFLPYMHDSNGNMVYDYDSPIERAINSLKKYIGKVNGRFVKNQEDDFLDNLCMIKEVADFDDVDLDIY